MAYLLIKPAKRATLFTPIYTHTHGFLCDDKGPAGAGRSQAVFGRIVRHGNTPTLRRTTLCIYVILISVGEIREYDTFNYNELSSVYHYY